MTKTVSVKTKDSNLLPHPHDHGPYPRPTAPPWLARVFLHPDFHRTKKSMSWQHVFFFLFSLFNSFLPFSLVAFSISFKRVSILITLFSSLLGLLKEAFRAQPLGSFRWALPSSMRKAKGNMKLCSLLADFPFLHTERHKMAFDALDSGTRMPWKESVHIILIACYWRR